MNILKRDDILQGKLLRPAVITAAVFLAFISAAAQEAQVGICVRKVSGEVLTDDGAGKNFLPASTLKLVTCGAALESLGAEFRFRTEIAYSGEIGDDGVLRGDLHIVGGGDPTLGSSDPNAVPRDSLFARWTRAVRAAGIRSIAGSVVGDSRKMKADVNGSWMYEDMATYYGTACNGLMFNRNTLKLRLRPGAAEGDPVITETGKGETGNRNILITPSEAPWMRIENCCVTGPSGSGDRSYLFISEFSPAARLGGSFALGKAEKAVGFNNHFADFSCAYELALHLAAEGIPCHAVTATSSCHPTATFTGSDSQSSDNSPRKNPEATYAGAESQTASAAGPVFGFEVFDTEGSLTYSGHFSAPDSLTTIAVTYSPKLSDIVRETLRVSDNLYAETLLRALPLSGNVGKHSLAGTHFRAFPDCSGSNNPSHDNAGPHFAADTEEALEVLKDILGNLGLDLSRTRLADGCGLSRKNSISPETMVGFLTAMASRPCFNDFLNALNTPGPDEILFSTADASTRSRIRLKRGSMTGVRCYSGYILPPPSDSPASGNPSSTNSSTSNSSHSSASHSIASHSSASPTNTLPTNTSLSKTSGTNPASAPDGDITVFSIMVNGSALPQSRLREYIERRLSSSIKISQVPR